jgi:hypothetical protein
VTATQFEPGSFRDRSARIFYRDGQVFRALRPPADAAWQRFSSTACFRRFRDSGGLVATEEVLLDDSLARAGWTALLRHDRVPFVSYPYEWSFGMLKDAALLQLDLLLAALDECLIVKDCSAYNVQWIGARPVFIDITSFEPHTAGQPWVSYRQFCQLFLYPLMLQAYKAVPFQPWLRGSLEGISPEAADAVMSARDHLRAGVLLHVHLQARAQRAAAATTRDVRSDLARAGFNTALIQNNVRGLRRIVSDLSWQSEQSTWSDYATTHGYEAADASAKIEFVRQAMGLRSRRLAWDLGANVGVFSRMAAEHADYVVAMDGDHLTVERLYRSLRDASASRILPLMIDLADPSPGMGWRGIERRPLDARGQPDMVLALALVHHMVISANVPLDDWIEWLTGLAPELVVEFVEKEDPMTRRLLRNKDDQYGEYTRDNFERLLEARMRIVRTQPMRSGTRVLYHAVRER